MFNDDTNEQIPLFGTLEEKEKKGRHKATVKPAPPAGKGETALKRKETKDAVKMLPAPVENSGRRKREVVPAKVPMSSPLSGKVPEGDVRLTANIREDLHLKLKIAAARRRTTIGELLEELVEKFI